MDATMTDHPTLSEFVTNEATYSRPASQPSTDETVTMTADERVATYLIEDQIVDLTDAIREAVQNGIGSPGSSRVLVSVSPERSLILDDGAGVDLESTEGRRNLSVLGAGTKQRADDGIFASLECSHENLGSSEMCTTARRVSMPGSTAGRTS
ncbi:hypothetical protein SAMN05192552_104616 [Natrinema hispanicum]|uniref:Uncharacterized protein n=2 Tax=Natrinema hispanicum TaxID=392421 RepID=A0A1I0JHM7_9EURY|nr:hypothetical protein SAMN05192552_104616 [Natrinema hispanicum]SEU09018.1 hypothetical protein SAMN04488694_1419 [Natrinema hispanicum]